MPDAAERPSRIRWRVLALLCVASFVSYLLRTNMSIAGESMSAELGFSSLQFGIVLSAFAWGYGLFQMPGGVFGAAVGARRAMLLLILGWAVLTFLTGVVPGPAAIPLGASLGALVALRFLMGAIQAPLYPITCGISIARWFPVTGWALMNGLSTTALTLGAAAAGPLVAWLVVTLGWRASFLVLAPVGLVMAGAWWALYRNDPAEHPGVNGNELALIREGSATARDSGSGGHWTAVLRNPDALAITASYFCMNFVFYLFFNWFFYYLVDVRGLPRQVGGNFTGAQWMVGAVAAAGGGWLCDRLSTRYGAQSGCRTTVVGGLLVCAPLLVLGAIATSPLMAVALLSLSFGATQLTDGAYWAAAMRIGGAHASAVTGLMNTGGNVVGGFGALLVPLVAERLGWVPAISTGALFAILGAALWIWIRVDRPIDGRAAPLPQPASLTS